jgi:hypothetical protein
VQAVEWALGEAEALLLERLLRAGEADSAIEQGWFLRELSTRFGLGLADRCFCMASARFTISRAAVAPPRHTASVPARGGRPS